MNIFTAILAAALTMTTRQAVTNIAECVVAEATPGIVATATAETAAATNEAVRVAKAYTDDSTNAVLQAAKSYADSAIGSAATPEAVTNIVRDLSLGGIWDPELEVWWTPQMRNGGLVYVATTNVNLNAGD